MDNFLDKFKDNIAHEKLKKGEGTGPTSKLLSLLSSHVLVLLIVFLLKDKLYISLAVFLLLGFTRLGLFVAFLGICYFIYTQYWTGVILISIYAAVAAPSGWIGHRYIKRNLFNGKTNISPFEGMNDLPVLYFLQLGLFGFALYTTGAISVILWVIYSLVTLFMVSRFWMRLKSKWCSIYYPLSIRYAHFLGLEVGGSERENKPTKIENAVNALLKNVYPDLNESEVADIMQSIKDKLLHFTNKKDLIAYCMGIYKNSNENIWAATFDKIQVSLQNEGDRQLPFFLYAEIIERDFGYRERLKFMMEVFNGKVV